MQPSIAKVWAVELGVTRESGYPLPAAWIRFQAARKSAATSGSLMIRPLLAWVQRPEEAQLVLPVKTRSGFPAESQKTTNLL